MHVIRQKGSEAIRNIKKLIWTLKIVVSNYGVMYNRSFFFTVRRFIILTIKFYYNNNKIQKFATMK